MEFVTSFQTSLDFDNKWVKLSKLVHRDKFASIYIKAMNLGFGHLGIAPRKVLERGKIQTDHVAGALQNRIIFVNGKDNFGNI